MGVMKNKYPNILKQIIIGLCVPLFLLFVVVFIFFNHSKQQDEIVTNILNHPYTVSNNVRDIDINISLLQYV